MGQFKKNLIAQYVLQVAKYVIPFMTLPYLTRVLGTEGFGVRAYVLSAMTIVAVLLDFGFMQTATKEIAENRDNKNVVGRVVGAVLEAKVILMVAVGIGVMGVVALLPILSQNPVYVAIAYGAAALTSLLPDFVFMGYETLGVMTTRFLISKSIGVLLTFLLIHSPQDLLLVPAIDVITSFIALAWTYASMAKHIGIRIVFPPVGRGLKQLKDSAIACVSNLSSTFFNSYTILAIGVIFRGSSDVALWSLSCSVISAVQTMYSPVYNTLYARMVAQHDMKMFKKVALIGLVGVTCLSVVVAAFAEPIVLILGGEEFKSGAFVIVTAAPVLWFSYYSLIFGWPLLGAFGYIKEVTLTTVCSGLFSIAAITLIGVLGIASLPLVATIRWMTEALLCLSRMAVAFWKRQGIRQQLDLIAKKGARS